MPAAVVVCDSRYQGDLGTLGRWFELRGFDVLVVDRLRAIPPTVADEADLLVLLGSTWTMTRPMGGPDDEERAAAAIDEELALVRRRLATDRPTLGLCFGGQVLCHALGGQVDRMLSGPFLGWERAETHVAELAPAWLYVHEDHMRLPSSVEVLARADHAPVAFRAGRAWGLQFHPEADAELLRLWFSRSPVDPETGAQAVAHAERRADEVDRDAFALFDLVWSSTR